MRHRFTHSSRAVALGVVLALALVAVGPPAARADEAPQADTPPPSAPAATSGSGSGGGTGSGGGGELDFNFFEDKKDPNAELAAKLKADALDRQVRARRKTLTAHQAFGITSYALLAATLVLGTLNYYDKFGGGDFTGRYNAAHLGFSIGSSATFLTTGVLGLAAPQPYKKPLKADAALFHKVMMGIATACFVGNLILGPVSASREGKLDQRDFAGAHLGIGYGAFAAMTAGWLAFVVK
jgi:hypothetical protein